MSKPLLAVAVLDLERGPKRVSWTLDQAWLRRVFEGTDATPQGEGSLQVELTKNGREVLVRGEATATVEIPESHTLDPVPIVLKPEVFLLLSPALPPLEERRSRRQGAARVEGQRRRGRGWKDDPVLDDAAAARDVYHGDLVVLDEFIREFLLLELPMVVRSDLPLESDPAIAPVSVEAGQKVIDPRLAPLAAIASRLRQDKE